MFAYPVSDNKQCKLNCWDHSGFQDVMLSSDEATINSWGSRVENVYLYLRIITWLQQQVSQLVRLCFRYNYSAINLTGMWIHTFLHNICEVHLVLQISVKTVMKESTLNVTRVFKTAMLALKFTALKFLGWQHLHLGWLLDDSDSLASPLSRYHIYCKNHTVMDRVTEQPYY